MKRNHMLIAMIVAMVISMCACSGVTVDPPLSASDDAYWYEETEELEETEVPEETEAPVQGELSLEEVQHMKELGWMQFFIRHDDNSFSRYESGSAINWGMPELYTYGTERAPSNMVIRVDMDDKNLASAENGELVFIAPERSNVYALIFPVIESGYAMSGASEILLWKNERATDYHYVKYTERDLLKRDFQTINGEYIGDDSFFEMNAGNTYVTLTEGDTYTIGEAHGTSLQENEYVVDYRYYLHTNNYYRLHDYQDECYELKLQPTTEGYARIDLSELPAGDYVLMYSYWHEAGGSREASMLHIRVK